jgi:hypothetical protein
MNLETDVLVICGTTGTAKHFARWSRAVVWLLLFILPTAVIAQDATDTPDGSFGASIYYQAGDNLYRITNANNSLEVVASSIPTTLVFSHNGQYVVYRTYGEEAGVWLSEVEHWNPQLIVADLPHEAFSLRWTPDDTRIILKVFDIPAQIENPRNEALAYNLETLELETWLWRDCNQFARRLDTGRFALICESYTIFANLEPTSIALEWGGDYQSFAAEAYEILVADLDQIYPTSFSWVSTNTGEHLVYVNLNPNYQRDNPTQPFFEIYSAWEDNSIISLGSSGDTAIMGLISVSPDRSKVAYSVFCVPSNECLQIADLNTGNILWSFVDTVSFQSILDIVWFPDDSRIALSGGSMDKGYFIDVFNIDDGSIIELDVDDSIVGTIVIR